MWKRISEEREIQYHRVVSASALMWKRISEERQIQYHRVVSAYLRK